LKGDCLISWGLINTGSKFEFADKRQERLGSFLNVSEDEETNSKIKSTLNTLPLQ